MICHSDYSSIFSVYFLSKGKAFILILYIMVDDGLMIDYYYAIIIIEILSKECVGKMIVLTLLPFG